MSKFLCQCIMMLICNMLIACQGGSNNGVPAQNMESHKTAKKNSSPRFIRLYSYDDFSTDKARMLEEALKKVYPSVSLQAGSMALPKEYYNKERNRYSGTGLLKDLSKLRKGDVVLGLTNEVIYKANEISPTYGIFGVSLVGAYVAVMSSTRPSGKPHSNDHLVKLMMHELGHSFGLNHCSDEYCSMVDAEHGNKFSQTPSFCEQCRKFLNCKGWTIK